MLSDAQVEAFEEDGVVLVDTLTAAGGLTQAELDDAEATWDELILGEDAPAKEQHPGFVRLVTHPWFEAVAKQMLRAEAVKLIELGPTNRPPTDTPQAEPSVQRERWASGAHIDLQISSADWNASPRRDLLALWLWVNDVPADRAAMRVLPGSHRPIMRHWDSVLSDERKLSLPRCHGVLPQPGTSYPSYPEHIPRAACTLEGLDYRCSGAARQLPLAPPPQKHAAESCRPDRSADMHLQRTTLTRVVEIDVGCLCGCVRLRVTVCADSDCEPMPVAVSRGTAQIFTQAMLHTAWHNSTSEPRKGFIISWCARKTHPFFPRLHSFHLEPRPFYQDRLGTNIGKPPKKESGVFRRSAASVGIGFESGRVDGLKEMCVYY